MWLQRYSETTSIAYVYTEIHRITKYIRLQETSEIIQSKPWPSTEEATLNHVPKWQVHTLFEHLQEQ